MRHDSDWQADLARYPARPFLKEQSIWAVWLYRMGRRIDQQPESLFKRIKIQLYWLIFRLIETLTGISLPKETRIGPGLRIWHFGNIFIHPDAVIGAHCTLRHGVTIGNRREDGPLPQIGDNVEFGAYAQVFGDVRVGDGAKIGSMSVVLHDVPAGSTVVGIPAQVVKMREYRADIGAVTVGNRSKIGANTVITRDVPDYSSISVDLPIVKPRSSSLSNPASPEDIGANT